MLLVFLIGQSKYLKSQGISNLRLASRAVRGEPVFPFSAALRAAESIGKIPESLILVPGAGLEPTTCSLWICRSHQLSYPGKQAQL